MLILSIGAFAGGCGEDEAQGEAKTEAKTDGTASTPAPAKAQPNVITGRVTMADGKVITTKGAKLSVSVSGVSAAGEKVGFNPAVKDDGTFKQKVPDGSYRVQYGKITVPYNGESFMFDLEPQGDDYASDRDPADGIVQNFVWRVTGPRLMYKDSKLDVGNHTHWNGMNVGIRAEGYRNDIGKPPVLPPDGTKLTLTLTPAGNKKGLDGSDLKPVVYEREHSSQYIGSQDLNDFLPGDYELSGVATLPDGTKKPILFSDKDNYPKYTGSAKINLIKDGILGGMAKWSLTYVVE